MIDRAVDISGTRIRDLARLGRELASSEQPARIDTYCENIAPVAQERPIGAADRRLPVLSGEGGHVDDGEHAFPGERTAPWIAGVPGAALAAQQLSQTAVQVAPLDDGRSAQAPVPITANRAPETTERPVPDRQPLNLAELGRAILPPKTSVPPTRASRPTVETARDWPAGPKTVTMVTPTASQVHYASDGAPGSRPSRTLSGGAIAVPPATLSSIAIPGSDPVSRPESIAPAGSLSSPPRQMPAQALLPPMAPAGGLAFPRGATAPAPPVSGNAAEPGRPEPSAPREPAHGDLVIDGMAIGRWISDHLADRVVRPHSGFSGMDPRLSPAWPGVVSSV